MKTKSLNFSRHGDKENSAFFEEYLGRLLEERDRLGLTEMVHEIDALMITVDPDHSISYIAELCLMTPYHYLVTLESESHWTHILRIDLNSPDLILREVKDPNFRGVFRALNEIYPVGSKKWVKLSVLVTYMKLKKYSKRVSLDFFRPMMCVSWSFQEI
jgi:hypothetical protein